MAFVTELELMEYIAQCAESVIEDDMNELGAYTKEEHADLTDRAMAWCYRQYKAADNG